MYIAIYTSKTSLPEKLTGNILFVDWKVAEDMVAGSTSISRLVAAHISDSDKV